jgi:Domain of unknown function (DUF4258)
MSETLERVQVLIRRGEVEISRHGFRELAADDILLDEVVAGVNAAVTIEDYPAFVKGPSVLVLQRDSANRPVHVVWGIPRGATTPAVLVTAYRPAPERWSEDFLRRRRP